MKLIVKVIEYFTNPLRILFMIFVFSSVKYFLAEDEISIVVLFVSAMSSGFLFLSASAIVDAIKESKK